MTTQQGLAEVFTEWIKCPLTGQQVRQKLYQKLKHSIPESEFKREFLIFRDTFSFKGMKVLHIIEGSIHRYVLTDNRFHVGNHNRHLNREIKNRLKRKVQTA